MSDGVSDRSEGVVRWAVVGGGWRGYGGSVWRSGEGVRNGGLWKNVLDETSEQPNNQGRYNRAAPIGAKGARSGITRRQRPWAKGYGHRRGSGVGYGVEFGGGAKQSRCMVAREAARESALTKRTWG
jgi:hypothetical protein